MPPPPLRRPSLKNWVLSPLGKNATFLAMKLLLLGVFLAMAPSLMADEQRDLEKLLEISAPAEEPPKAPTTLSEPSSLPADGQDTGNDERMEEAAPPPPKMTAYKVWIWQETGDTLWRIAEKVYGDKDKWRLIYLANKDVIKDPNKIYPKQRLKIPPPDWQP